MLSNRVVLNSEFPSFSSCFCVLSRERIDSVFTKMASRNLTAAYLRHREATRSHKSIRNKTNMELRDFKVQKNLLAAHSDDEGSTVDARVYSVPPMWVSLVDDMNRDISQIKIKRTRGFPDGTCVRGAAFARQCTDVPLPCASPSL